MFAKLLALGTPNYIGLPSPGTVSLSSSHPQQLATWEIIDPLQIGATSLTSGMEVTIKSTSGRPTLLEWFTSGGGGVRATTSIIPTGATKFLIRMPGQSDGTVIPHDTNITLSAKPILTGWRGFIRGLLSIFTGSAPAWYVSANGTNLALTRLATPGTAQTFRIFQAPLLSAFTITPPPVLPIGFQSVATAAAALSFMFSTPPGGATVDFTTRSGSRYIANFPPQITVPEGLVAFAVPLLLTWRFRSCEKLSIDATTVLPFVANRAELFMANLLGPVPYFRISVTPDVIQGTVPPTATPVLVEFTYDASAWPTGADQISMTLTTSDPNISSSWTDSRGTPSTRYNFTLTPIEKQDCFSIKVDYRFLTAAGEEKGRGSDGIVVKIK